jgi:putative FmdB family regulatory protein
VPLYAFHCESCGPFEEWRLLSDYSKPARCPRCDASATRVFTPPNLVRTPEPIRKARMLEEKSAHEPDVVCGPLPGTKRHKPHTAHGRPWMIGHGH